MNKSLIRLTFVNALLISCTSSTTLAQVLSGTIVNWRESSRPAIQVGDGTNHVSMWWSINTTNRGWFYGSDHLIDSDVAFAAGVSDVRQITNAGSLVYTSRSIGPYCDAACASNHVGDFIVWRNINSGHFGVLRIDDIDTGPTPTGYWYRLQGTWWFQANGTGNFAIPEPTCIALFAYVVAMLSSYRFRPARISQQ